MREIKFRCWDVLESKFVQDDNFIYKELTDQAMYNPEKSAYYILQQFTGMRDKNGKEIYEGDIVRFHYFYQSLGANLGGQESEHELTGIVKWQVYGYGLSAIKGEHWRGYTGYEDGEGNSDFLLLSGMSESSIHEESFEIIGSIHENPALLHAPQISK